MLALRCVLFAGGITWQRATWRVALLSPHLACRAALLTASAATLRANDARLRRLCAAARPQPVVVAAALRCASQ